MIKKLFALMFSILFLSACSSETPFEDDLPFSSPTSDPPPSIFVDSELYTFFDTAKESRYATDDLEYLGDVIAVTNYESDDSLVPKEDFYSSCFPVGTEIYRIDKDSLYIEYTLYDSVTGKSKGLYSGFGYKDE